MARYKVVGYIEAGHSMWFDEARREVRTLRPSDCQQPISGGSTACNMSLITGDEVDPDTGEVWWGSGRGRSEYFAKVFKYPYDKSKELLVEEPKMFAPEPKESDLFWKPDLPATQPKYGESAMTSEVIGGKAKPKLEWKLREGAFESGIHVLLTADGKDKAETFVRAPYNFPALTARQARKLEKKIEAAKAGIMRTYLLTVRQSGPVA